MAYYQGFFRPLNPKKYRGNVKEIVYRSGWEAQVMMWLDSNKDILAWSSEEVIIRYRHPFRSSTARPARYFVDFWWKQQMRDGTVKEFLCEVKPFSQTQPPTRKGKNGRLLKADITYAINTAKWKAAKAYADQRGMTFMTLTENTTFNGINFQGRTPRRAVKGIRAKQNASRP